MIKRPTHYFAMPREILCILFLASQEKVLLNFFYSMSDDCTMEKATPASGMSAEQLKAWMNSLMSKRFLDYESGYRLRGGGAL